MLDWPNGTASATGASRWTRSPDRWGHRSHCRRVHSSWKVHAVRVVEVRPGTTRGWRPGFHVSWCRLFRSTGVVVPQTPWCWPAASAKVRHSTPTGHSLQIRFAAFSRAARAVGRSPAGGKKIAASSVRQAADKRHCQVSVSRGGISAHIGIGMDCQAAVLAAAGAADPRVAGNRPQRSRA